MCRLPNQSVKPLTQQQLGKRRFNGTRKTTQRVVQSLTYGWSRDVVAAVLDRANGEMNITIKRPLSFVGTVTLISKSTVGCVLPMAVTTLLRAQRLYAQTVIDENILDNKANKNLPRKVPAGRPREAMGCLVVTKPVDSSAVGPQ